MNDDFFSLFMSVIDELISSNTLIVVLIGNMHILVNVNSLYLVEVKRKMFRRRRKKEINEQREREKRNVGKY
jgi:hypothetical protein